LLKPHGFVLARTLLWLLCKKFSLRDFCNHACGMTEPKKASYARTGKSVEYQEIVYTALRFCGCIAQ
jgi:hypothetical protein